MELLHCVWSEKLQVSFFKLLWIRLQKKWFFKKNFLILIFARYKFAAPKPVQWTISNGAAMTGVTAVVHTMGKT